MVVLIASVEGCTEVQITAPTGELVVANSLEAGNSYNLADLQVTPTLRGSVHGGKGPCMAFTAKYGFISGIGGLSEAGVSLNEHALDLAVFQQPDVGIPTLCRDDVASWILGTMGSVAELQVRTCKMVVVCWW
jgi:penicillin V acylase-like amidase (Ntn superfamily)